MPDRRRALLGIAALAGSLAGCGSARFLAAAVHSTDQYLPLSSEPRLLVEPGGAAFATAVEPHVSAAIDTVEVRHYRPFPRPVAICVCASTDSFVHYSGASPHAKGTVGSELFLNPSLLETPARIPAILTHELSHLHLAQQLGGIRRARNLPAWFQEGLATLVADGGGAETVTVDDARRALRSGLRFEPVARDSLLSPRTADYWFGQQIPEPAYRQHLFYRQAMLFVGYLRDVDEARFRALLLAIQDGGRFGPSLERAYGVNLALLWQRFLAEIISA